MASRAFMTFALAVTAARARPTAAFVAAGSFWRRPAGLRALQVHATSIRDIGAREILDSRGNPTVEVDLSTELGTFRASVPSGASTGEHEALELRDGDQARFKGKGVLRPLSNIQTKLLPAMLGLDPTKQGAVDQRLLDADGTHDKSALGANALLAVSLAACKAGAAALNLPLYKHIADLAKDSGLDRAGWVQRGRTSARMPIPWLNVINGGAHAGNRLAVQEIMIGAVGAESFAHALRAGTEVYHELKGIVSTRYGPQSASVGDEGGFAPDIGGVEEALQLIWDAIVAAGHQDIIKIGLDVAASELTVREPAGDACIPYRYKLYPEQDALSSAEMIATYCDLCQRFPIVSIEDPLSENDWEGWAAMTTAIGQDVQVVGDDLTVSSPGRIARAIEERACNALLLKVNQIGTVTEALQAAALASNAGWGVMVSHRSGETEDTFIADLAVGLGVGQIKSGAPCRSERVAKYNQLLRIEEELAESATFAGARVLQRGAAS